MAIRNEVQGFGSALLITIANTSLFEGEKFLILRWWNQTTKAMTTIFIPATRCKGNKGGSKECKAQKICFACSSTSYYIHGNSHVEVEKGLTR
jgi:hypothetical protein